MSRAILSALSLRAVPRECSPRYNRSRAAAAPPPRFAAAVRAPPIIIRHFCSRQCRHLGRDAPAAAAAAAAAAEGGVEYSPVGDELSKAELASRFVDARAAVRAQHDDPSSPTALEAQGVFVLNMLRTRLPDLGLNRAEGRQSALHGMGLFALRDIEKDELITLYPGDALLVWGPEGPGPVGCPLSAQFGAHVSKEEQDSPGLFLRKDNSRDYEISVQTRLSIVGDPARDSDPSYLGHLANDAASLSGTDAAARTTYSRASAEGANAAHLGLEGCHFGTFSTRAIAAGEEVLVSYGEGYWLSRVAATRGGNASSSSSRRKKKSGSGTTATRKKKSGGKRK